MPAHRARGATVTSRLARGARHGPLPRRARSLRGAGSSVGARIRTEKVSHTVATITINVPAKDARIYLEEVLRQVDFGFTSGHVDRDTNWDAKFDAGEHDGFAS